jgi:hypothetical protein
MDSTPYFDDGPQAPRSTPREHALRSFFRAATSWAFARHRGLHAPAIEDHISDGILAEFVHVDRIHSLRDDDGEQLAELSDMAQEGLQTTVARSGIERDLEVHQHVGDYALYMAGIFPEFLEREAAQNPTPLLACVGSAVVSMREPVDYYIVEGRSAYSHVSKLYRALDSTRSGVFHRLSNRFEEYLELMGLIRGYIREQENWEAIDWGDEDKPGRLIT